MVDVFSSCCIYENFQQQRITKQTFNTWVKMGNRSGRNLQAFEASVNAEGSSADESGNNAIAFPGSNLQTYDMSVSPDSSSADDSGGIGRGVFTSLPSHIWSLNGIKCPVCSKFILPDDIECHLVMCLTKPRLSYNEDVLSDAKGECVICLEDLSPGDVIARLPCLCIYHKGCIDQWFEVNRCCPEHPGD
ncbi:E3 ubiquitin-protein ligase ZNRF2 [Culicoides brevitarsis]|uniref:E3 ubiquitin-protein ligase ZNRF2 n=1 Tax=Culicoides brevitarsis TaxID=469753 RepID=UPI00307BD43B